MVVFSINLQCDYSIRIFIWSSMPNDNYFDDLRYNGGSYLLSSVMAMAEHMNTFGEWWFSHMVLVSLGPIIIYSRRCNSLWYIIPFLKFCRMTLVRFIHD